MKRLFSALLLLPLTVSADEPVVVGFQGSYGYYGELWYPLHIDPTMGLGRPAIKGADYDANVQIDQESFPGNSTISWQVPQQPPEKSGVYGYPHVSWGAYERSAQESPITPLRVDDIGQLSVTVELSQHGTPDGASVLNEFYLLSDPDDPVSKLVEVGLFATSTASSIALMDDSEQVGRFRDPSGREWIVASTQAEVPFIMFRPADDANVTGTVDWRSMLTYLRDKGRISGQGWFAGMAIGPEPRMGEGQVILSVFAVRYQQR